MTDSPDPVRALGFGSVAEAYDHHRLGYPTSVLERIVDYAQVPITTALEVGAGTGKATRMVATAGIEVVASEPDPRMLAVLRAQATDLPITTMLSTFEELPVADLACRIQLVFSAAAWHWTDPATRWTRTAELLPARGTVAIFNGVLVLADPDIRNQFLMIIGADLAERWSGPPFGAGPGRPIWPGAELIKAVDFEDVQEMIIERPLRMGADAYADHLATQSTFITVEPNARKLIMDRVRAELPSMIDIRGDVVLHLARRR